MAGPFDIVREADPDFRVNPPTPLDPRVEFAGKNGAMWPDVNYCSDFAARLRSVDEARPGNDCPQV